MTTDFQAASTQQAKAFSSVLSVVFEAQGLEVIESFWKHPETQTMIDYLAAREGEEFVYWIQGHGSWRGDRPGLLRTDTIAKVIAHAWHLSHAVDRSSARYIVVTSDIPTEGIGFDMLALAMQDGFIDEVWKVGFAYEVWKPE